MLRTIRIILAAVFFILITLLFLDFTGVISHYFAWLAKVQFLPAVLSLNLVIIALLLVVTLVFGRIYCSVVCPLGVMQDIFAFFGRRRKRNPYKFSKEKRALRYGVLVVFVLALCFGFNAIAAIIAPYSAYGRIAVNILRPVYLWGNNLLAYLAERIDSYAFYGVDVWVKSGASLACAAVTLFILAFLAWRYGRLYCNAICPVGTVLGLFSRFSLLKIRIKEERCVSCGRCSRQCKASCIDSRTHVIDYSRCILCGDCIGKCNEKALVYGLPERKKHGAEPHEPEDKSRRAVLLGMALAGGATLLAADRKKVDGGLAVIEDKT
ncbi:MAG: 4Fe-4S binding protein, partial [Prevotella sp.]|nr:4Fe-4S binding protein [Prevotella sp.]